MDHREPAGPAFPGPPAPRERDRLEPAWPGEPCEQKLEEALAENARLRRELAAKNTENARLKDQVAELRAKLGWHPEPPAPPFRPFPPEGPWGKGPGGLAPRFLTAGAVEVAVRAVAVMEGPRGVPNPGGAWP